MDIDSHVTDDERMEEDVVVPSQAGADEVMVEYGGEASNTDDVMDADADVDAHLERDEEEGGLGVPELDMRGGTPEIVVTDASDNEDEPAEESHAAGGEMTEALDSDAAAASTNVEQSEADRVEGEAGGELVDDQADADDEEGEDGPPAMRTRSHDPKTPPPDGTEAQAANGDALPDQEVRVQDEFYDDEEDYSIDVHTMPPVLLHLPDQSQRWLFSLPEGDENGAESSQAAGSTAVWLEGRHEELGEASLADVWAVLREEMSKQGAAGLEKAELVVTEKQMDLKMGESDVNLQSITLLNLLHLHHGCDLPIPVELFVSLEPHRFITRYQAIKQELEAQAEREASEVYEDEGEEGEAGLEAAGAETEVDEQEADDGNGEDEEPSVEAGEADGVAGGAQEERGAVGTSEEGSESASHAKGEAISAAGATQDDQTELEADTARDAIEDAGHIAPEEASKPVVDRAAGISAELDDAGVTGITTDAEAPVPGTDDLQHSAAAVSQNVEEHGHAEDEDDSGVDAIANKAVEEAETATTRELAETKGERAEVEVEDVPVEGAEVANVDEAVEEENGLEEEEGDEATIKGDEIDEAEEEHTASTLEADADADDVAAEGAEGEEEYIEGDEEAYEDGAEDEAEEGEETVSSPSSKSLKRPAEEEDATAEIEGKRQKVHEDEN